MLARGNLKLYEGNDTVTTAHREQQPHPYSYNRRCHLTPSWGAVPFPQPAVRSTVIARLSGETGRPPPFAHLLAFLFTLTSSVATYEASLVGIFCWIFNPCFPFSLLTPRTPFHTLSRYLILPCLWCLYLSAPDCNVSL